MKIRLGTRGSKLALAQADIVSRKLKEAYPNSSIEIIVIQTEGDIDLCSPLSSIGGKGVFIRAIEKALLENKVDIAVHSLKDVTTSLLPELQLSAFLKAEAFADVIVFNQPFTHYSQLPPGAIVATSSMRRKALLRRLRPDVQPVDVRGNVLTRLEKLRKGAFDAIILSEAGLIRLGLSELYAFRLDPALFCPAPGQGVIALETRKDDLQTIDACRSINSQEQTILTTTELAFLERVHFDCSAPLGLFAEYGPTKDSLFFTAFMASSDMQCYLEQRIKMNIANREENARRLADEFILWRKQHDC